MKKPSTIDELERILNSEPDRKVEIMPDGTVRDWNEVSDLHAEVERLKARIAELEAAFAKARAYAQAGLPGQALPTTPGRFDSA